MLRQIRNLRALGRIRTSSPTRRAGKPRFLVEHPELEISDLLEFIFARKRAEDVFFVQIGAFDGRIGDPLFNLVKANNWRGILVEPQSQAFEDLKKNYADQPQLLFFNVAIGAEDGEVTLYTRKNGSVSVASLQRHFLIKPGHGADEILAQTVPCWTFETLMRKAGAPAAVDLVQIDAEGHDYEIIRSINFDAVRPAIIRYEHALLSERDRNACLALLAKEGYRFLLEDFDTTAVLRDK